MIVVITIAETRQILAEHGFNTSEAHIRAGIECGAYPFGVCIPAAKSRTFEVYKPLLMQWIKERSEG
jgi:hypothetical protein